MKIILGVLMAWSVSAAHASAIQENYLLGTVDAWSEWFHANDEVDPPQVCTQVLTQFQLTNEKRPYHGELALTEPVGFKSGTNVDGKAYFALSCRLRVYRVPLRSSL